MDVKTTKTRNPTIDVMKGLAILCVVWGHVVANNIPSNLQDVSFNIIYSFHMPLFFVVAGFVLYESLPKAINYSKWLKNKAVYLLVPFIVLNICFWVVPHWFPIMNIPIHDDSFLDWLLRAFVFIQGDWFLWTMFWILALLSFITMFDKIGRTLLFWSFLVLILFLFIIICPPTNALGMSEVQWYLPFTVAGYLIAKYGKWLVKYWWVGVIGALAYTPIMFLTHFQGGWIRMGIMNVLQNSSLFTTRVLQALTGISLIACIAWMLRRVKVFQWLGRYSLGVYLTHWLFIGLGFGTGWKKVTTAFVISLACSIIIILILQHIKYLQRWFPRDNKSTGIVYTN